MKDGVGPAPEIIFNSFLIFSLRGPEKDSFNRTNHLEFQRQVESLCCNYLWKIRLSPLQSTSSFITFPYWGLTQQEHILFNISCFPFLSFRKEQFYSIRLNLTLLLKYFKCFTFCAGGFLLLLWIFFLLTCLSLQLLRLPGKRWHLEEKNLNYRLTKKLLTNGNRFILFNVVSDKYQNHHQQHCDRPPWDSGGIPSRWRSACRGWWQSPTRCRSGSSGRSLDCSSRNLGKQWKLGEI